MKGLIQSCECTDKVLSNVHYCSGSNIHLMFDWRPVRSCLNWHPALADDPNRVELRRRCALCCSCGSRERALLVSLDSIPWLLNTTMYASSLGGSNPHRACDTIQYFRPLWQPCYTLVSTNYRSTHWNLGWRTNTQLPILGSPIDQPNGFLFSTGSSSKFSVAWWMHRPIPDLRTRAHTHYTSCFRYHFWMLFSFLPSTNGPNPHH